MFSFGMPRFKTRVTKILTIVVLSLILLVSTVAIVGWYSLFRTVNVTYESAEEHFKYGSIGTEASEGLPYWIWMVLPRIFPEYLSGPGGYVSLGMTWEAGKEFPVGISKKTIGFPRQGVTCALCHHATYRTTAADVPTIVPTAPANRFDLQAYLRFLSQSAHDPRFTPDYLLDKMKYVVNLSWFDRLLYRFVIIPRTRAELFRLEKSFAWMDKQPAWGPGRIDPFNPVKFRVLNQPLDNSIGNSDMMPIWNQAQHQGFARHWDGLETSLTETVRTGAIGDGATKESIEIAGLQRVEEYISQLPPPQYPFAVDPTLAAKGNQIFTNSCATCHAFGGERTGTVIPQTEVGTDRHRLDMWTQAAADTYNKFADGYDWDFQELRKTDGYVAVALDGLWLRAPYLHNGSVPSLQDLLQQPEARPQTFYRGYDVYDPVKVGFISEGAAAERFGFKYDTTAPGNSNQGHPYGTDLAPSDREALIEYLKTL